MTMTAEEMEDGMLDQCDYFRDAGIARFRAVVEQVIGAVKKWKIMENECFLTHVQISELQDMLVVICLSQITSSNLMVDHGEYYSK